MIEATRIATNVNAPEESSAINLYSTGLEGGSNLTLGQLAIAVSLRAAAAYESQSILKMNRMANDSYILETAAGYMQEIAEGSDNWAEIKAFCRNSLGITSDLPDSIDTYERRMDAITAMKAKVDALTQSQQTDMIDMQSLVNRRDTAYSASSNMVRALGKSMYTDANNF
jgi:hypothetical protein